MRGVSALEPVPGDIWIEVFADKFTFVYYCDIVGFSLESVHFGGSMNLAYLMVTSSGSSLPPVKLVLVSALYRHTHFLIHHIKKCDSVKVKSLIVLSASPRHHHSGQTSGLLEWNDPLSKSG